MNRSKKELGQHGEDLAVEFLQRQGYKILERNFRNKLGEVDIIALDEGVICFIEVKTRRTALCGTPFEAISRPKQFKLARLALSYLKYKRLLERPARFDVMAVSPNAGEAEQVEIIKNAFDFPC